MRLLNTQTLKFEEFFGEAGNGIPSYAILSHTWGLEEVSYQDHFNHRSSSKRGWEKMWKCARLADSEGFRYMWIDTCCIDKSSSAELSEAINSMFQWYRDAAVCYAFLSDVDSSDNPALKDSSFSRSRWFTRGWTLQELLAPRELVFFGADWNEIGSKKSLCDAISRITRIGIKALDERRLTEYSVAQKMSWAAGRQTTRPEDEAYCLMGLFDVNMPMLYGEGRKAFYRLQQEILKQSDDQSLFAWSCPLNQHSHTLMSGLLAPSPEHFKGASDIELLQYGRREGYENTFELVHQLVRIKLNSVERVQALLLQALEDELGVFNVAAIQQAGVMEQATPRGISAASELQGDNLLDTQTEVVYEYEVQRSAIPEITIETVDPDPTQEPENPEPRTMYLDRRTDNAGRRADFEGPPAATNRRDQEEDSLGQKPNEPTGPGTWRWYIYEPVTVVSLRCSLRGRRLGILLSRDATHGGDGILSRLHNPSLIAIGRLSESQVSFITAYVRISTRPREPLQWRPWENQQWPEIRIKSLLSAGYVLCSSAGPNWELHQSQSVLVPKGHYSAQHGASMMEFAPLALFLNHSIVATDPHNFFFSIPTCRSNTLICEVGVFGRGNSTSSTMDFELYSCNLASVRHSEIPLINGQSLVVRYREGTGVNYVILSIEELTGNIGSLTKMASHNTTKTPWLTQRLFPMLRSLRPAGGPI